MFLKLGFMGYASNYVDLTIPLQVLPGHQRVAKWGLNSVESKEHDKAMVGMLTIDLLPMYFVCKSGYLLYSALTSPKYEVKSEYYYRGLIDKVRFPTLCDMPTFDKLLHGKYFWTDPGLQARRDQAAAEDQRRRPGHHILRPGCLEQPPPRVHGSHFR